MSICYNYDHIFNVQVLLGERIIDEHILEFYADVTQEKLKKLTKSEKDTFKWEKETETEFLKDCFNNSFKKWLKEQREELEEDPELQEYEEEGEEEEEECAECPAKRTKGSIVLSPAKFVSRKVANIAKSAANFVKGNRNKQVRFPPKPTAGMIQLSC